MFLDRTRAIERYYLNFPVDDAVALTRQVLLIVWVPMCVCVCDCAVTPGPQKISSSLLPPTVCRTAMQTRTCNGICVAHTVMETCVMQSFEDPGPTATHL